MVRFSYASCPPPQMNNSVWSPKLPRPNYSFTFRIRGVHLRSRDEAVCNTKVCTSSENFTRVVRAKKNFNSGYRLHKFLSYDAQIHVRASPILQAQLEQMARPNRKQHGRHYSPHAAYRVNYAQNKLPSPKVIGTSARYYDRAQQFRTSRHAANNLSTNT